MSIYSDQIKPKLVEAVQVMFLLFIGTNVMSWKGGKWGKKKRPDILNFKVGVPRSEIEQC